MILKSELASKKQPTLTRWAFPYLISETYKEKHNTNTPRSLSIYSIMKAIGKIANKSDMEKGDDTKIIGIYAFHSIIRHLLRYRIGCFWIYLNCR